MNNINILDGYKEILYFGYRNYSICKRLNSLNRAMKSKLALCKTRVLSELAMIACYKSILSPNNTIGEVVWKIVENNKGLEQRFRTKGNVHVLRPTCK